MRGEVEENVFDIVDYTAELMLGCSSLAVAPSRSDLSARLVGQKD